MQLVVPRRAIIDDHVFVVESIPTDAGEASIVKRRPVTVTEHIEGSFPEIDPQETQWAVIGRGMHEGDRIVVSNLDELSDSLAVEVSAPTGSQSSKAPGP